MSDVDEEFIRFVDRSSPSLLRTAFLLTAGDRHLAEDLVQQSLLATYRSWSRLRDTAAAVGYARVALVNGHRDHFRRRWGRERPTDQPPDSRVDPGEDVEARADILGALAELAPGQRAVIVCRFFEDMTELQTAEALGCSVGTVKSQCHTGLRRLRAMPRFAGYARTEPNGDELPCH